MISIKKVSLKNIIDKTLSVLRRGGLVVYPSDTVYGLLVDATNGQAVTKLIKFKERPPGKPISVFVDGFVMMEEYVKFDKSIKDKLTQFLPGSFTIILPSRHKTIRELESEQGALGVRYVSHPLVADLVKLFSKPITATSANLSSKPPHYSIESFLAQTSQKRLDLIDLIVDAGKLPYCKPSTVLDYTQDTVKILREGSSQSKVKSQKSKSEVETKKVAKDLLKDIGVIVANKPVVMILKGDLGAGKTIFVKGIGEALGVKNIISPTFVVYYEYDLKSVIPAQAGIQTGSSIIVGDDELKIKKLVHVDLYNVQGPDEFAHLGLDKYLQPQNLMCIEWGEKSAEIIDEIRKKAHILYIHIKHIDENKREIIVSNTL